MEKKNMKPITNPQLKKAIEEMQNNNSQENVNKMIDCVMNAQFITPAKVSKPTPVAKNNGNGTVMQNQTQVQFQLIENQNKEKFFPAFTDAEEKQKWQESQGKDDVVMNFESYVQVLSDPNCPVKGFVINPFGRSVAFPKDMVMSLKQQKDARNIGGLSQQKIEPDKVTLGDPEPDEYPIDMMAAIINFLQERDDVNAAYLKTFQREEDEKPAYLIIIDFDLDKMEEIFKGVSTVSAPHLGGYQLSMMPYSVPFAKKAVEDMEPFFEK